MGGGGEHLDFHTHAYTPIRVLTKRLPPRCWSLRWVSQTSPFPPQNLCSCLYPWSSETILRPRVFPSAVPPLPLPLPPYSVSPAPGPR